jgi:serralysin
VGIYANYSDGGGTAWLEGGSFGDVLVGGVTDDTLNGGSGNDTITGWAGSDNLAGGEGTDTLDYARETGAGPVIVNLSSLAYTVGGVTVQPGQARDSYGFLDSHSGFENVRTGSAADSVLGSDGDNVIAGGAGADTLDGGGGRDTLDYRGELGEEPIIVNLSSDEIWAFGVSVQAGEAMDSYGDRDTISNFENVTARDVRTFVVVAGSAEGNDIETGAGDDYVDGGDGADTITGGDGSDTLSGSAGLDVLDYSRDAGTLGVLINLSSGEIDFEGAYLFSGQAQDSFGYSDWLSGFEIIRTGGANDIVFGGDITTVIDTGAGDDFIQGGNGAELLFGREGNDRLRGGFGADIMDGGTGDDTYYIEDAGDQVIEQVGGGSDAVYASVSWTLAAGQAVEALYAAGNGLALTGNELANHLISGVGVDVLVGGAGNDSYYVNGALDRVVEAAGDGTDTVFARSSYILEEGQHVEILRAYAGATSVLLIGNELDNRLISGDGDDILAGGLGNDRYDVNSAGDHVSETSGGGTDMVYASVSYALGEGQAVEVIVANAGATGITLTGNELSNWLYSREGNDVLAGGLGNDTYYVNGTADQVIERVGAGTDTVFASDSFALTAGQEIEVLRANAGAMGITLTGNELDNRIVGGAGADVLVGGEGYDVLTGGAGADRFVFRTLADSAVGLSRDYISDFVSGEDIIDLSWIQAVAGAESDMGFAWLKAAAFTGQAGQLHQISAGSNTVLEGDVDGDRRADFQILLKGQVDLQASDIWQ